MDRLPDAILSEARRLFYDVRPEDIDPSRHEGFIIARVLDRGTISSVAALVNWRGLESIRRFFVQGGRSRVTPQTWQLWATFLNLGEEECTSSSSIRRKSPFWTV